MEWEYEPDEEPKWRHFWDKNEAGFMTVGTGSVGKCPKGISKGTARKLLNSGIQWSPPGWAQNYPKRIYAIHKDVVYRATPTIPGKSYHGFPESPTGFSRLPKVLKKKILEHAKQLNCLEGVRRWLEI